MSVALREGVAWFQALADAEFAGRGDREKAVLHRLSKRTGVAESYLRRLKYKAGEMKDIAGEPYRRLGLAYHELCQRIEDDTARMRNERERNAAPKSGAGMAGGKVEE